MGYHEIAEDLRRGIKDGTYPVGETLPNQRDLAKRYGVNIGTVRRAIALLARQGEVDPIRRRGTVVRGQSKMTRLGPDRYAKTRWKFEGVVAFAADREASGLNWRASDQTQRVERVEADPEVADAFGLETGDEVVMRARLITDDDGPTHTLTSYYRPEHVEGTLIVKETPGPAGGGGGFEVLTLQGYEPDHIREVVYARMATSEEIESLKLPAAGEPVMILKRWTYTADDELVEFARGVHRASKFAWTYGFKIPEKAESQRDDH